MRFGKFLLSVGAVLLLISTLSSNPIGDTFQVSNRSYKGIMFRAPTNVIIEVRTITQNFNISLYVLDEEDTIAAVLNGNLENASPLFEKINVHDYTGVIVIPTQGIYSVIVTTSSEENIDVSIKIAGAIPHQVILLTGAIFSLLGAFLIFIPIVMKRKKKKTPTGEVGFARNKPVKRMSMVQL